MLLDFEIRSCSRQCAKTGKEMSPGDVYFSVLQIEASEFVRRDYCAEAWQAPTDDCVGWWRSRVPTGNDSKPKLAPAEVMLNLFAALGDRPADEEFRYLLGLLLLRRRFLRHDDARRDQDDREVLVLHCPRRSEAFELVVAEPDDQSSVALQQRIVDLLYGDGDPTVGSRETNDR